MQERQPRIYRRQAPGCAGLAAAPPFDAASSALAWRIGDRAPGWNQRCGDLPVGPARYGKWMRMLELWQLLQSPLVIVWVMEAVSGHLLISTFAGKATAVLL